jgi:adenylate cyclase
VSRSSSASAGLGLALLALLLAHSTGWLPLRAVDALDAALYDQRLRAFAGARADARIAVVDIDERALAAVGRWPWPRERLATLVDRLFDAEGVRLVGLDMILAEPESKAADARLAATLARHPAVLGFHLNAQPGSPRQGDLPAGLPGAVLAAAWPTWHGHAGNLPALQQAAAGAGFVNAAIDRDGLTRRAPLFARYEGQAYGSLAMAMAYTLRGDAALALSRLADAQGQVLLPYPAPSARVLHVSAADVLAGSVPANALRGRAVLVGMAAAGLIDQHSTPTGELLPGVELHANLLAGLLAGRLPQSPVWAPALTALLLLGTGLALVVGLPRLRLWPATAAAAALAAVLVGSNLLAWAQAGLALPIAAPLLLVAGLYTLQLFFGQLAEALARRRLAALFGHYVPPELVKLMSRDPARYTMAPRSAELSVLFADVRGFTTFSEQLSPPDLAALMNRYLSVMTDIVREHRGTLDKYIGDALMAFWGAPLADAAHAQHAVQAALAMQAALPALNAEFAARGWPLIRITIGINTGPMVVGDMGSRHRRAYTVLGDAVNVAARLQELSGKLESPVVVGEATRQALPPAWPCREIDRVTLRGRATAMTIFEPLAATASSGETVTIRP